jgi:dipeptidyl aminopeptidase/acylaminoacyl peptidase
MTTFDRFDPFERRIGEALEGIAPPRQLDYLDDVFRQTARASQRPRWSFPERWFKVDTALARPMLFGRRVPFRSLLVLVVLASLLAATAFYVGTREKLPPPFGLADNGQIVFMMNDDLYVQDSLTGLPRLLIAGPGVQAGPVNSPDGQLIAYDSVINGADRIWVAEADGSNPREVLDRAFTGQSFAWAPDSRSISIVTHASRPELWIAPADGSGARLLELEGLYPWEATWDPQQSGVLLVRAEGILTREVDLYYVDLSGAVLSKLDMDGLNINGAEYEFSSIAFSPDGKTIAYNSVEAREAPVNRFRAHVMNRDGTGDRAIPAPLDELYSQAWPIFSPDGTWIAMESWVTQPDNTAVNQIAIAPADGSATARWIGPQKAGQAIVKAWSPDGTRLLLCFCDVGEVYAADPVAGTWELLPGAADLPAWQRVAH